MLLPLLPLLLLGAAESVNGCSRRRARWLPYNRRVKEELAAKSSNFELGGASKSQRRSGAAALLRPRLRLECRPEPSRLASDARLFGTRRRTCEGSQSRARHRPALLLRGLRVSSRVSAKRKRLCPWTARGMGTLPEREAAAAAGCLRFGSRGSSRPGVLLSAFGRPLTGLSESRRTSGQPAPELSRPPRTGEGVAARFRCNRRSSGAPLASF